MKKLFLCATLLITSSIQMAEAAGPAFWRKDQVACGNIVSVRKSGQLPMYDDEYIKSTKSHRQANEVGVVAMGLGVLGPVGAAIASIGTEIAVNTAIDGKKPEPILEIVDPNYNNGNVRAIRIALDDGREINLPVIRNNIGSFGTYAAGDRVNLVLSRQQGVLQIKYRATAKVP
jgi:hypothetical protein